MTCPTAQHPTAKAVLNFWFSDDTRPFWFVKSDDFDDKLTAQFADVLIQAGNGETDDWRTDIYGRLAEIIVLDQFSRNIYRNTPKAFAFDGMALILAQEAIKLPAFADLNESERHFLLMPYMHSESKFIHEQAVVLFKNYVNDNAYDFELKHKIIIDKFGRYPHRNAILGRISSDDEMEFLKQPNSSF